MWRKFCSPQHRYSWARLWFTHPGDNDSTLLWNPFRARNRILTNLNELNIKLGGVDGFVDRQKKRGINVLPHTVVYSGRAVCDRSTYGTFLQLDLLPKVKCPWIFLTFGIYCKLLNFGVIFLVHPFSTCSLSPCCVLASVLVPGKSAWTHSCFSF